MRIDHAQLSSFAAVVHHGSFDAAARWLHVTPSAISQRIRQLEERLGQILIERGSPCRVTTAGQPLLRYAEQVALLESETLAALGVSDASGSGTPHAQARIPLVINADSFDSWFGDVFAALVAHPEITLDVCVEDQAHSLDSLRSGAAMVGVSATATAVQGCRVEPLGIMRYRALATPAYMARHLPHGATEKDLAQAPMLIFNRKDGLQDEYLQRLIGKTLQPPTHSAPTTAGFHAAILHGLAWGMIPDQLSSEERQAGTLVDIDPDLYLDVPLYWHRWRIDSDAIKVLTQYVRSAARQTLLPHP
jgi:LysR family transcriptional regulator (chromosome initiation inhibitor)